MNKTIKIIIISTILIFSVNCYAQVSLKTEYIGTSQYWHEIDEENREKVGNSKGSTLVHQGSINLPLFVKMNKDSIPTIWQLAMGGAYAQLTNKNFTDKMVSEIMNIQLGVIRIKPLNNKWTTISIIGGGIYAPFTNFSKIRYRNILGNVAVTFVKQLKPNLNLGAGLAINSTFGYPMIFPAIYFDWAHNGNFNFNISMMNGLEVKAGYEFNKNFKLNLKGEVNGQLALLEKNDKEVMFSQMYIITGISPEIAISKHITVLVTTGINIARPAYYNTRSLKGMFTDDDGYYFGLSPYASARIDLSL